MYFYVTHLGYRCEFLCATIVDPGYHVTCRVFDGFVKGLLLPLNSSGVLGCPVAREYFTPHFLFGRIQRFDLACMLFDVVRFPYPPRRMNFVVELADTILFLASFSLFQTDVRLVL